MSKFEVWHDRELAGFRIDGRISDRDLMFDSREAVAEAKRQIIAAIVDKIMEKLSPQLEKAISETFKEFNKECRDDDKMS